MVRQRRTVAGVLAYDPDIPPLASAGGCKARFGGPLRFKVPYQ